MVADLAGGMFGDERHADRLDAELVERVQLEGPGRESAPRRRDRVRRRERARAPGWCCRSRSRTAARRDGARSSAGARARCSRRSRPARSSGSRPGCASRATPGSRRATSGTSSGGSTLRDTGCPGPATITSARRSASQTSGTQRGRSGSRLDAARIRPPAAAIAVSPLSTRPSANSATSVTSSVVAGSTVPRAPTIRAAISTARAKVVGDVGERGQHQIADRVAVQALARVEPVLEDVGDQRIDCPTSAARQLRMSPGRNDVELRAQPSRAAAVVGGRDDRDEPIPRRVVRARRRVPQSSGRSPRSTFGRPVPPPSATTRGSRSWLLAAFCVASPPVRADWEHRRPSAKSLAAAGTLRRRDRRSAGAPAASRRSAVSPRPLVDSIAGRISRTARW